LTDWAIAGTYLESCNCDAICPCRRIGGRAGGRSTHGICLGALSWQVREGHLGDVELAGLGAVIVSRYSDDEPGSPWTYYLYVDERGDAAQRDALASILTGAEGGTPARQFPWVFKDSDLLGWRAAPIAIDHTRRRGWFRVDDTVTVRIHGPIADQEPVTCVIPGHDRDGEEQQADLLRVDEGPLTFELSGVCAYAATFVYASAPA
jgi:hypothetical protein